MYGFASKQCPSMIILFEFLESGPSILIIYKDSDYFRYIGDILLIYQRIWISKNLYRLKKNWT